MKPISTAVVVALLAVALGAQTPRPTFEVASIKKLDQPITFQGFFVPPIRGGTLTLQNSTVASLIQFAYSFRDFQVVGGPDWITKDLFEVQARAAGEPSPDEMKRMLQSLLEDRFGLVTHRDSREMRYFAMVLARSDGRPGPYLHRGPDTGPCISRQELAAIEKARPKPSAGYAMVGMSCGALTLLAQELASRNVELPVFDRTGLTGRWSANLYFAPDPNASAGRPFGSAPAGATLTPDPNLASFATALQEQLGLKLEPARGPVDVLVIDAVRQPTEN